MKLFLQWRRIWFFWQTVNIKPRSVKYKKGIVIKASDATAAVSLLDAHLLCFYLLLTLTNNPFISQSSTKKVQETLTWLEQKVKHFANNKSEIKDTPLPQWKMTKKLESFWSFCIPFLDRQSWSTMDLAFVVKI